MTTTRARLTLVSLFPVAALAMAACAADTDGLPRDPGAPARARHLTLSRAHFVPVPGQAGVHAKGAADGESSANAHMTYRGGPVISNVKVFTVYWDASVPNQSA